MLSLGPGGRFTLYGIGGPIDTTDVMALLLANTVGTGQTKIWNLAAYSRSHGLTVFSRFALMPEYESRICGMRFERTRLFTEPHRLDLTIKILDALGFGANYDAKAVEYLEVLLDREDPDELLLFNMALETFQVDTIRQVLRT